MSDRTQVLVAAAWEVLQQSARSFGFVATSQDVDNYARLWSRDSAIASLAVLAAGREELYPTVEQSLENLLAAVGPQGVFPSNCSFSPDGALAEVSYGGPVGRTDSPFWWAVAALSYLEVVDRPLLKERVMEQIQVIEARAHAWEFNNKNLMYAPASSNWADEYPVEGYILLNNVLRYWMLAKAGRVFNNNGYRKKSVKIRLAIKAHFFGEPAEVASLFTEHQKAELAELKGGQRLLMSFTPGRFNNKIDALGWSLAFLLGLASDVTMNKAFQRCEEGPLQRGLAPAHWPIITESDPLWSELRSNYAYAFKNVPGHFHNGGVWGLTQGFAAAMMAELGRDIYGVMERFEGLLQDTLLDHPFPEYFEYQSLQPGGVRKLCFTAAGYLLADAARRKLTGFKALFERPQEEAVSARSKAQKLAAEILAKWPSKVYRISGESGCGKSTLATAMVHRLEQQGKRVLLYSQDDFFRLPPRQNHNQRVADFEWIGPGEVDWPLLNGSIAAALEGRVTSQKIPVMNWETDTREWVDQNVENVDVVLVEGTYVLSELAPDEIGIYFEHTYKDTKEARIARNREVVDDFIQRVLEREHHLIRPLRKKAQVIITKNYELR